MSNLNEIESRDDWCPGRSEQQAGLPGVNRMSGQYRIWECSWPQSVLSHMPAHYTQGLFTLPYSNTENIMGFSALWNIGIPAGALRRHVSFGGRGSSKFNFNKLCFGYLFE